MKLNKIIGMTAALLIGVGTVAASHADSDKKSGPRKAAHAKKEGGAKAHAHQGGKKLQITRKVEKTGRPQRGRRMQQTRGQQGGPPAHIREMMQKRMSGARGGGRGSQGGPPAGMREMMQKRMSGAKGGGRGQGGPKARGGSRGGSCEKCGANKRGEAKRKRGDDNRRGGRKEQRGNRGSRR